MFSAVCAVIAYADGTCSDNCGIACSGYGTLPTSECPPHLVPCCGVCNYGTTVTEFESWTATSAVSRAGCNSNKECLVCNDNETSTDVNISSGHTLFISSDCSKYVPSNTNSEVVANLTLVENAKDITIRGPGTILSKNWPLKPGTGFTVFDDILFLSDGYQSPPKNTAILIESSSSFSIDAQAPHFKSLVTVASPSATQVTAQANSKVRGSAQEVLLSAGHVTGNIEIDCTLNNQSIVLQATKDDNLALTFAPTSLCSDSDVVHLSELLAAYGRQYDILFFEGPSPRHISPVWKEAQYVWYAAATLILAVALSHEAEIKAFFSRI